MVISHTGCSLRRAYYFLYEVLQFEKFKYSLTNSLSMLVFFYVNNTFVHC